MKRVLSTFALFITLVSSLIPLEGIHAATVVSVTRKDRNLYKVDGQRFWVQTKYCYEYGYGEQVALDNYSMTFLEKETKCQVRSIMQELDPEAGNYSIKVTYEDSDFYSTSEGLLIQTSICLEFAFAEDAILRKQIYGGKLIFLDSGKSCDVERILSPTRI